MDDTETQQDEIAAVEPAEQPEAATETETEPAPAEPTADAPTPTDPVTLESLAERVARIEAFLTPGHVKSFADVDPIA